MYERQSCDLPVACSPASAYGRGEAKWDAILRDLSSCGVRLILRRRFEPGTALAIELPAEDESYTVLARVVNVRAHEGGWALGCQFVSALSDSEQERLLAPKKKAGTTIADVQFHLLAGDARLAGFRVRRFHTHLAWPLASGEALALKGKDANGQEWKLSVEVASCERIDGRWTVTCRLGGALTAARLLTALGQTSK